MYAVLLDTGCDWPDVIFVGSYDDAQRAVADLPDLPDDVAYTVAAVVSAAEALEHREER